MEDVKVGSIVGYLYFSRNFSESIEAKLRTPIRSIEQGVVKAAQVVAYIEESRMSKM